jgi:hypothetical protein
MLKSDLLTGTIADVVDHGSIVQLILVVEGRLVPVHFDHRPFRWLLEGEQCGPQELIGRVVQYDGESVEFLDQDK